MIDAKEFEKRWGVKPAMDDLDRVNCKLTGRLGHFYCGICFNCLRPRFACDCLIDPNQPKR